MKSRVRIDRAAVDRIVDRVGSVGAPAVARFLEAEQKSTVQSRRLRDGITSDYGRDARGWYARAGMKQVRGTKAFFWFFHEYQTGRGQPGRPFIRPSLNNNGAEITRLMLGRGGPERVAYTTRDGRTIMATRRQAESWSASRTS